MQNIVEKLKNFREKINFDNRFHFPFDEGAKISDNVDFEKY